MADLTAAVRLYALLARSADRAVVFRRGPSKQTLLLDWNLATDEITEGQWLKGRVYERRCDLSPDGELLLYFAANYRPPYLTWSAVSRPPYLTALALWPKGDAWGGGGHFVTNDTIALNHREGEIEPASGFRVPKSVTVRPFGSRSGSGEDDPVWSARLERDGWILVSGGRHATEATADSVWIRFEPPIVWEKPHPVRPDVYRLQMTVSGLKQQNGPWYVTSHRVTTGGAESHGVGSSDWAEWAHSGDLLFARGLSLYRLRYSDGSLAPLEQASEVIDLENLTFTPREAPDVARRWPRR